MNVLEVIKGWIKKEAEVLDLGCGDGKILNILSRELQVKPLGIEIDEDNLNKCIASGLSVIQQDIDDGLDNFSDNSLKALLEVTRIGTESIVTIPNFGFWTTRFKLLFSGKMPVKLMIFLALGSKLRIFIYAQLKILNPSVMNCL